MATNDSTPRTIEIQLTKGYVAIVDEQDADLASFHWYTQVSKRSVGYAARRLSASEGAKITLMHRAIMQRVVDRPLLKHEHVDHIDGDGLNNCRSNLRLATRLQNMRNSKTHIDKKSPYKGTSYFKPVDLWRSYINFGGKQHSLGYFLTEEEAAIAYNFAAIEHFGEFAKINDIPDWQSKFPNKRLRRDNQSGYTGVSLRENGRWKASVRIDKRTIGLGCYNTPEEAHMAQLRFLEGESK